MCILGAGMAAPPRAPRPAASPASGPRMTSFVQNSFLTGLRRPESANILAERHRRQPGEVMALVGWKCFFKI